MLIMIVTKNGVLQWRIQTLSYGGGGGGGGLDLLALSAIFPSVISSFFTQNKGGAGPPGPSPRSATVLNKVKLKSWYFADT